MANEITTDNINTKAQEVASIGDGDYVYIFKTGAQGFSRIAASHFAQGGSGGNASKVKNIRDDKEYRLWVGTQAQLEALNGAYQSDVIYIVAQEVQGTEISITGISVSCTKSSATPNTYNLVATLSPGNTTQTSVEWTITSGNSYATLSSNGLTATLTVLPGASGNSVVVRCSSTENTSVYKNVTQDVTYEQPSVEVTITDINVSSTVLTNVMQCTAVFSPSGYTIPVTWSVSDTSIATINSDGRLTVKASGTVTVYANEFSKQISVTYHNESYDDDGLDFTATRTAPNTMTLAATNNGSSVNASFALSGTVPTVKKLQNGVLTDVPAVEISGNTLTYHDDCTVSVSATYGGNTQTKAITIAHNDSDYIWFEDDVAFAVVRELNYGSSSGLTYTQAAAITAFKPDSSTSRASVVRFKEFKWFTGCTSLGPNGNNPATFNAWSSLEVIALPSTLFGLYGTTASSNPFYSCKLKELHVSDIADYCAISYATASASFGSAGKHSDGLGLFINGSEVTNLVVPNSVSEVKGYAFYGFSRITSATIECAISGLPFDSSSNVSKVKIGDSVTELPESLFSGLSIEDVEFGGGISALPKETFRKCFSLSKLTLNYDGVVSLGANVFYVDTGQTAILPNVDLYVPSNRVSAYNSDSTWNGAKSINEIPN